MSTDWDVYCPQCDDRLGLIDANHEQKMVFQLIEARDGFAALARVVEGSELTVEVKANNWYRVDETFFAKHAKHKLVARSEYGDILESLEAWQGQRKL